MNSPAKKQKAQLRETWKQKQFTEPADRMAWSRKICEHLAETSAFRRATQIAVFAGQNWEVDLGYLWAKRPNQCYFPKTEPKSVSLRFYRVKSLADLRAGYVGILEPNPETEQSVVQWQESDLILVPGFAFDASGGRLGAGKGFYDRFLAQISPQIAKWGICFDKFLSPTPLPMESHDVPMDGVVTQNGLHRPQ